MSKLDWSRAAKKKPTEDYRYSGSYSSSKSHLSNSVSSSSNSFYKDSIYKTNEWKMVRNIFILIFKEKCFCCNCIKSKDNSICLTHIKNRFKYPYLALDMLNMQLLCRNCIAKGNKLDYRTPEDLNAIRSYINKYS